MKIRMPGSKRTARLGKESQTAEGGHTFRHEWKHAISRFDANHLEHDDEAAANGGEMPGNGRKTDRIRRPVGQVEERKHRA